MSNAEKPKLSLPEMEEKILAFWEKNNVFEETLKRTKKGRPFVFYEGPPTANGAPGIHHVEARAFKDIIPRYKTMRGFYVPRRAGWDTHGLPVEIQIEKELGFKTKQDIEKYGIAKFNARAKESVWRYKDEWEKLTRRIGFWLDMDRPYITYEASYMETLWHIVKETWKKGLLVEDFKVVPWCPRCGTGLSSHELGQPGAYKKVKENSVYVKLKISDDKKRKGEYLLVWTTTPWTIPANVAVAVNPQIEYTKYKITEKNIFVWSATPPPDPSAEVVEKVSGRRLIGIRYEPPISSVPPEYLSGPKPKYEVIAGDFVSVAEGTGIVHIAPAFGDEDMEAVKKHYGSNYPIFHTVNIDGTMKKGLPGEGKFVKGADPHKYADPLVIQRLEEKGSLFAKKMLEHDYPHCWRCDTPVLYFAKNSWWIKMSEVKKKLLESNEKINWIPGHLKSGRFGEFLRELRDWAFSRERYWGTPLPVWKCPSCGIMDVIGSRAELHERSGGSKNNYIFLRHGEAVSNAKDIASTDPAGNYGLTLRGRVQAERAARKLKQKKIDLIFASDILRAKETAGIVAGSLGIKKINFDERLREIDIGDFEGETITKYHRFFEGAGARFISAPQGGETLRDVRRRVISFMRDMEKKYEGKTILVVSHGDTLWMAKDAGSGLSEEEINANCEKVYDPSIRFAEPFVMEFKNLPRDESGEVNLHRPYVDDFFLICPKCRGNMQRVPEVADVWFDSGAMPFAQGHWPFAQVKSANLKIKDHTELPYPADFIAEAIDQTRGWFYTLLAVGTLMGKAAPYKNVISLGHVLDKNGQKMSKSRGNVVNPWDAVQKYGADAVRWYFYTVNSPGDPKRFDEKDLGQKLRGFLMIFWNCFVLFDTYAGKVQSKNIKDRSKNVLDRWILAKLDVLISGVTSDLDEYDIYSAARSIEQFVVNDFSQWFLRRSRRRLQHPNSPKEKKEAGDTAALVLLELCRISAPFIPFLSESIYQELRKKMKLKVLSVHALDWPEITPKTGMKNVKLLEDMDMVRSLVAEALKLRAASGIKVRQPLASLQIPGSELRAPGKKELLDLIKDEVNVKKIIFGGEIKLDTVITSELKAEGMVREFVRNIQEMRRDAGFKPGQKIRCRISGSRMLEEIFGNAAKLIKKETNSSEFLIGGKHAFKAEREVDLDGQTLWIGID